MPSVRQRDGIGALGILALGVALFLAVSIISTGGRGLGFTDSGFLRGPRAPTESTPPAAPTSQRPPRDPVAPTDEDLALLRARAQRAQAALVEALESGRAESIEAARTALERAQAQLSGALATRQPKASGG